MSDQTPSNPAPLNKVAKFFGGPLSQFTKEWKQLSDEDRTQIREGIGNGTLTY